MEVAASQNLSDQILRKAVFDLLVTWLSQIRARASDLEADSPVVAAKDQLLSETLTLMEWSARWMQQDIKLEGSSNTAIMRITPHSRPLVLSAYKRWRDEVARLMLRNNA